ncbi:MAG: hypothetical protein WD355_11065, partial [Balneolaceae bacterium]
MMGKITTYMSVCMMAVSLLFLTGYTGIAYSQTVTGIVTDATTGESIPGANVVIQGTTIGTSTGLDGD